MKSLLIILEIQYYIIFYFCFLGGLILRKLVVQGLSLWQVIILRKWFENEVNININIYSPIEKGESLIRLSLGVSRRYLSQLFCNFTRHTFTECKQDAKGVMQPMDNASSTWDAWVSQGATGVHSHLCDRVLIPAIYTCFIIISPQSHVRKVLSIWNISRTTVSNEGRSSLHIKFLTRKAFQCKYYTLKFKVS